MVMVHEVIKLRLGPSQRSFGEERAYNYEYYLNTLIYWEEVIEKRKFDHKSLICVKDSSYYKVS